MAAAPPDLPAPILAALRAVDARLLGEFAAPDGWRVQVWKHRRGLRQIRIDLQPDGRAQMWEAAPCARLWPGVLDLYPVPGAGK
jgi:hypothetical protein